MTLVLSAHVWLLHLLLTFPPDTDGFTPQLQIPITTQSDQRRHMELAQWWVESRHTQTLCLAKVSRNICGEHRAPLTPGILHLSTGQFVQGRIQPLHPVLTSLTGAEKSLLNSGTGRSVDAAGQVSRSLGSPPVPITTSPRETKHTEVVNTVWPFLCSFYWQMLS